MADNLKRKIDIAENDKRNWEIEFQRWLNRKFVNCEFPFGYCGRGVICSYCSCDIHGKPCNGIPCATALNKMSQRKPILVNYKDASDKCFENAWYGNSELKKYQKLLSATNEVIRGVEPLGNADKKMFKKFMERDGFDDLLLYKNYILDNIAKLTGENK